MRYRVTVSQRYRRDPHPAQHRHEARIHPDGWIDVMAVDADDAARTANEKLNREWVGIYGDDCATFHEKDFALGRLFTLTSDRLVPR